MKRTLTLLTLLLALLALLVLPAAAADLPRLVDNADLLMADDAEALLADLDSRSEALQFDIVIVTASCPSSRTLNMPRHFPHSRRNVRIMSTKRGTAPPTTQGTCPTSRLKRRASCGSWPACCSARSSAASRSA